MGFLYSHITGLSYAKISYLLIFAFVLFVTPVSYTYFNSSFGGCRVHSDGHTKLENICYIASKVKKTNTHLSKTTSFSNEKSECNKIPPEVDIWDDSQESNLFFHFAIRSHNRIRRKIVMSRDGIHSKFNKYVASGCEIKYCNSKNVLVRINSIITFVKRGPPEIVNNNTKSFPGYVPPHSLSENINVHFYSNNINKDTSPALLLQIQKTFLVNDNECKKPGNHTYKSSFVYKERGRV